ncbi:uncharacterized protein LOC130201429 isoform X3 [Pseudoliparis swirei]|uniref:uncharacterized protein LOC130201429 isoform X3 n=1 Tax=Pseudoliparis swirei TaxID=2059687 RepID=UPI0024BEB851|nr:uncharacterized protein LOC130201429 isoform X3 [Pseudoliparis swirei]
MAGEGGSSTADHGSNNTLPQAGMASREPAGFTCVSAESARSCCPGATSEAGGDCAGRRESGGRVGVAAIDVWETRGRLGGDGRRSGSRERRGDSGKAS